MPHRKGSVKGHGLHTRGFFTAFFIRFSHWRNLWLRHLAGYPFGASKKNASAVFCGTAYCIRPRYGKDSSYCRTLWGSFSFCAPLQREGGLRRVPRMPFFLKNRAAAMTARHGAHIQRSSESMTASPRSDRSALRLNGETRIGRQPQKYRV